MPIKAVTNPFLCHMKQEIQDENGKGEGLSPFISRTVDPQGKCKEVHPKRYLIICYIYLWKDLGFFSDFELFIRYSFMWLSAYKHYH